jgi:hypothetical protein
LEKGRQLLRGQGAILSHNSLAERRQVVRIFKLRVLGLPILLVLPCYAQQGQGNECTPAGTWYGGSVVAYHMTVTPAGPAGHYVVTAQGMYKNTVMNTLYAGISIKNGRVYEGNGMSLATTDPDFLNPPPIGKLPDIISGWFSMEMVDCNWIPNAKIPLVNEPDVDMIPILTGDVKPIVETYHRLPETVNPALLHK